MSLVLGVDIGGTGTKAAIVDLATGTMVTERHRIDTPRPATAKAVGKVVGKLVKHFGWEGPVGVGFPGVVQNGIVRTAANLHKSWVDLDADAHFTKITGCDVVMINDADAAGMAEMRYGAGKNNDGTVIMLTLGTGIGSALFRGGQLVPNLEFGHLVLDGEIAEDRASSRAKEERDLSMKDWANEVEVLLVEMEKLFWPDLFVIGGGISKRFDEFVSYFDKVQTPVVAASMRNHAGVIGAALVQA
jgi:polyphosphate glucokinase